MQSGDGTILCMTYTIDKADRIPLLLHACCGPCSLEPVRVLREQGFAPTILYANGNIRPEEEYRHRLDTLRAWAAKDGIEVVEVPYDAALWEATVGPVGEAVRERFGVVLDTEDPESDAADARRTRCRLCYRMRFEQTARWAHEHGYDAMGTTLSVSPYQYTDIIREELERAAANVGVRARFEDYRAHYDEATRRSRELGIYRQSFCGCRFSEEESRIQHEQRAASRAAAKAARAKAREPEEERLAARRAERAAYDEKQRRKRAVLKSLREDAKGTE